MLLYVANAYEMLHFSESKADALNEVIGALLRHTQRHSGKFLFGCYHLNSLKKS